MGKNEIFLKRIGTSGSGLMSYITIYHNRMAEVNFLMIHIYGLGVAQTWALLALTPDRSSHVCINGDYGYL